MGMSASLSCNAISALVAAVNETRLRDVVLRNWTCIYTLKLEQLIWRAPAMGWHLRLNLALELLRGDLCEIT